MAKLQRLMRESTSRAPVSGLSHDLLWAVLAPLAAIMLREDFVVTGQEVNGTIIYVTASLAVAAIVFPLFSMRLDIWEYTTLSDLARVAIAVTVSVLIVNFLVFTTNRHEGVARAVPFLHFVLLLMPLVAARIAYRLFRDVRDRQVRIGLSRMGDHREHVLVFGVNRLAEFYASAVRELADGNVEILGIISNDERRHGRRLMSHPVLGHAKYLPHFMQDFAVRGIEVNKIVVCSKWDDIPVASQTILRKAERDGIRIEFLEEILDLVSHGTGLRRAANDATPLLATAGSSLGDEVQLELPAYFRLKRLIDLVVATTLAVCSFPVMVLVAALNRITIGAPVLFWQRRPGRHGINFCVYKFRTMLAPYDDHGNRVPDEKRQTFLTRLVRRTRLDELPQLYNIIVGEMSLIGPRPLLPRDQPRATSARLAIAPGITGLAQVNGGDLLTPDEKLALDVYYIRNASLWLDIKIVLKTLQTVKNGDVRNEGEIALAIAEFQALYPEIRLGAGQASVPTPQREPAAIRNTAIRRPQREQKTSDTEAPVVAHDDKVAEQDRHVAEIAETVPQEAARAIGQ
jgi:lipopolysaccharide/colanic/teichoic acid biosynthesis glycosyltransferase